MKRWYALFLIHCCSMPLHGVEGKTFFTVTPLFQIGSPLYESIMRNATMRSETSLRRGRLEFVFFGSRSFKSSSFARYFLPFGGDTLLVAESGAARAAERDVDAVHLNINHEAPGNTFQSRVSFMPRQSVWGVGFGVTKVIHSSQEHGFWLSANSSVQEVRNQVRICEQIDDPGGTLQPTRVADVTSAFKQASWLFGKVDGCVHQKAGLADIELQIGYEISEDGAHMDFYVGTVIPTGNRPSGEFLFESVCGNNRHAGVLFGLDTAAELYGDDRRSAHLLFALHGRYLFANTQTRSFDLSDKRWGRYMEVYPNKQAAELAEAASPVVQAGDHGGPGINQFTQKVRVHPKYSVRPSIALLIKQEPLVFECGYTGYARQAEKVKLACPWIENPALVSASQAGRTTKSRTINHAAAGSDDLLLPIYAVIKASDLDIASAAHSAVVAHTVYCTAGIYEVKARNFNFFSAIGGSYEFSSDNASINRWAAWGKAGFMF